MSDLKDIANNYDSVWDYLSQIGILEKGTAEDIEAAKKQYWREYKTNHKRNKRKSKPELAIIFENQEEKEWFLSEAKKQNKAVSKFIKECALAYLNKNYVQAEKEHFEKIEQLLRSIQINVQNIADDEEQAEYQKYQLLIQEILSIEYKVNEILNEPLLLEESIKKTIQKQSWKKEELKRLIENL